MFDLLIQNVSVLMPDFSVKEGQNIYVKDSRIVKIADAAADDAGAWVPAGSEEPPQALSPAVMAAASSNAIGFFMLITSLVFDEAIIAPFFPVTNQ